jgi:pimeloyl-ACP methyl ester carboxylesterase
MRATKAGRRIAIVAMALVASFAAARAAHAAELDPHDEVRGTEIATADVRPAGGAWQPVAWDDMARTPLDPGSYEVRVSVEGAAVEVPDCGGRAGVSLDGRNLGAARTGPLALPLPAGKHELLLSIEVSKYEGRVACGDRPRVGTIARTVEGLGVMAFGSPYARRGGGRAVVYVPPGHDVDKPGVVLVGTHPWNGSMWTYAAYAELLRQARSHDVVLLMPSGLGNSLYVADAEDEVMRALSALERAVAVDARAVSIWGASMGGAGATTIGLHHPDRFASITSFFGDSKYDVTTYVKKILPDDPTAHLVNALDVLENARHVPVWLIHGEDDKTSPIRQSEMLAQAMKDAGFTVRFDRVPGIGHAGALVGRFVGQVVDAAATARVPESPARVSYRSVRAWDESAYGVRIVRADASGDAVVDVERRDDGVHVLRAQGVRAIVLSPGALGTQLCGVRAGGADGKGAPAPAVFDDAHSGVRVHCEATP